VAVDNVILILSDSLRRDCVGCYGRPQWAMEFKTGIGHIQTPHLDRFAETALVFDRAYIASFPTVLARNDLLTGRYTWTFKKWSPLDAEAVTLQDKLKAAKVFTGLIADTPHPYAPGFNYQRGFQTWELIRGQELDPWQGDPIDPPLPAAPEKLRDPFTSLKQYLRNVSHRQGEEDYFAPRTMRTAAQWLERNHRRSPFFLMVDTFDPHEPWDPPQHYIDLYDPGYDGNRVIHPIYGPCNYLTEAELNHCRAMYAGEVSMVDHWIGFLLDRIASLGLLENTAVFVFSDHGFYHGEHGYIGKSIITEQAQQALPLYPEVARVPLLAYLPGMASGARTQAAVQTIDLMATVCDLFGVPIPETVQARSMLPILEGEATVGREFVISSPEVSYPGLIVPPPTMRSSVYRDDWLLVYGSQVSPEEADRINSENTTRMVDSVLREVRTLEPGPFLPMLFDLASDPNCRVNVIEQHRSVAESLIREYIAFLEAARVPEGHLKYFRNRDAW
jgi:arylsulfatase A-like enzyme